MQTMQTIWRIDLSDAEQSALYGLADAFTTRVDAVEWARLHAVQWATARGWSLTELVTNIRVDERHGLVRVVQHRSLLNTVVRRYQVKAMTLHETSAVDALAQIANAHQPGLLERLKTRLKAHLQTLLG